MHILYFDHICHFLLQLLQDPHFTGSSPIFVSSFCTLTDSNMYCSHVQGRRAIYRNLGNVPDATPWRKLTPAPVSSLQLPMVPQPDVGLLGHAPIHTGVLIGLRQTTIDVISSWMRCPVLSRRHSPNRLPHLTDVLVRADLLHAKGAHTHIF